MNMENENIEKNLNQYCTFFVDGHLFGINVTSVQEISREQKISTVPLSHSSIKGLINLRGQIITALDFRQCFKIEADDSIKNPMNVVLHSDAGLVSLIVDKVGDVIEIDESMKEETPANLSQDIKRIIEYVCWHNGRYLLIVSPNKIISIFDGKYNNTKRMV